MAALSVIRFNKYCKELYERLVSKGKSKKWDCSKNPHCHSERSEESHIFFSSQKIKKRDPSDFVLRTTRKGKFTKILEHSQSKKLVSVAVAHKLLRQVYGVLKSKRPFDENFCNWHLT
jgi:hypothetical protein